MTGQRPETSAVGDAPDLGDGVVAAGHDEVSVHCETAHAGLMTDEDVLAQARVDVPDPQRRIARAGDGVPVLGHLQASHG